MSAIKNKIDRLDRMNFVKFIKNLILKSDNYKRDTESKSYVMAINSAWGTGKSYFVDLLIQDVQENSNVSVVKYNAWENDYCDNAFNPLIYDILNADCLDFSKSAEVDEQNIKELIKNLYEIGMSFSKKIVINTINEKFKLNFDLETLEKSLNSAKTAKKFILHEVPNLKDLDEQRAAFNNLKNFLCKATQHLKDHGKKLVVIVDELDRCKPTFAIQTLEIVKHIFDVNNIVFLFAVDIEQLSHSISCVYGQGFDSVGYLCRFFDYIAEIPLPNIKQYIQNTLSEINSIKNKKVSSYRDNDTECLLIEDISEYMALLYSDFSLSLRELDTILKSYIVMLDNFLSEYELSASHIIYLFFLTLKYKKPMIFNNIFIKKENCEYTKKYEEISKFDSINVLPVHIASTEVLIKSSISEMKKPFFYNSSGESYGKSNTVIRANEKEVVYRDSYSVLNGSKLITSTINYGNLLFAPDLKKWEKIKNYTYGEYIHKQLENYNFTYNNITDLPLVKNTNK